ncbi:MAG: hypothetical protein JOZ19_07265 [Rubrobacter sp.]|nr:hypothetical protein [Rubrobacter sp.]
MADDLSSDQYTFLEAACKLADRFNDYQVDEEALMNQLTWDEEKFTRTRNELEDASYITRKGAPQISTAGGFWIEKAGIDLCPEPLEGRDALQSRE